MNSFLFFTGIASGFMVPGYLICKYFRIPNPLVSSLILSIIILYNCIFWVGLALPLTFTAVLIPLTLISVFFLILNIRDGNNILKNDDVKFKLSTNVILLSIPFIITSLIIFLRSAMQPFHACDGEWRWNFLAEKLFYIKTFSFYPPVSDVDFYSYPYPDGIPPLVSFSYFWIYASFGQPEPFLTAFFITGQFFLTGIFCYLTTKNLFPESKYSPYFVLICFASSPLLTRAFVMGQDTGLTALSMTGMLYYLTSIKDRNDFKNVIMAALCASIGALSREYGCAFIICGSFMLIFRKLGIRSLSTFILTSVICAAPWYIRNWIIIGTPLFIPTLGGRFGGNEVLVGLMKYANGEHLPIASSSMAYFILNTLIMNAPIQILIGTAGCLLFFKRIFSVLFCIITVFILWLYSIKFTPGIYHSLRVLSPALAMLSILSAGIFYFIKNDKSVKILISASILIWIVELPQTLVTPLNAWQLPYKLWYTAGFILPYRYGDRIFSYLDHIPAGAKVLNDDAYLYSSISKSDISERRILVVPTFSPEVKFLVDMDISAKTACKLLRGKGIKYLIIDELASPYFSNFKQFPFFRDYKSFLKLILYSGDTDIKGECLFEIPE